MGAVIPPRMHSRPALPRDREQALTFLPPWLDLPAPVRAALPEIWAAIEGAPVVPEAMEDLSQPPERRLQAWGVSLGLAPATVAALGLDAQPAPHLSRTIYQLIFDGHLAPMSEREIARCNARGELVLFNLQFAMREPDLSSPRTHSVLTLANDTFRRAHSGYQLAAMVFEGGTLDEPFVTAAGFRVRPYAPGAALDALPPERRPRLYGLTREEARASLPGTTVRHIFDHVPPRFQLSATQRRLLTLALMIDGDDELAPLLGTSAHGLKKLWRGIFERIVDVEPEFFGAADMGEDGKRGAGKRRQVLAYVRQRPEELRPWAAG